MEHCPEHSAHKMSIEQHDHRLEEHGKSLDALSESLAVLRVIEQQNQVRIDEMNKRLAAPADKWRKASDYVLTAILGVVLGLVASNFGL